MIYLGKHSVLGTLVDAADYDYVLDKIFAAAQFKKTLSVSFLASHGVMESYKNSTLRSKLNTFDLVLPDGQSVKHALNFIHDTNLKDRVCGPDLTEKLLYRAEKEGLTIYFYGSTSETLEKISSNLRHRFPRLKISGLKASLFREASIAEREGILSEIIKANPDIILVGLGCPKQEHWIASNLMRLNRPCLAVGAVFDFLAGNLKRPSKKIQNSGFEWLYRWIQEPKRLFKRYFILGESFLFLTIL